MLVFGIFKWHCIHSFTRASSKLHDTTANQNCNFSGATTPIFNLWTLQLPREYPKLQFLMQISQRSGEDQNMHLVSSLIRGMRLCMDTWATSSQSRQVVLGLYSSQEVIRHGCVSRITSAVTPGFVGFTTKLTKYSRPGARIANYALFKLTGNVLFLMYCLYVLHVKANAASYPAPPWQIWPAPPWQIWADKFATTSQECSICWPSSGRESWQELENDGRNSTINSNHMTITPPLPFLMMTRNKSGIEEKIRQWQQWIFAFGGKNPRFAYSTVVLKFNFQISDEHYIFSLVFVWVCMYVYVYVYVYVCACKCVYVCMCGWMCACVCM